MALNTTLTVGGRRCEPARREASPKSRRRSDTLVGQIADGVRAPGGNWVSCTARMDAGRMAKETGDAAMLRFCRRSYGGSGGLWPGFQRGGLAGRGVRA